MHLDRKNIIWFGTLIAILALDIVTKRWALESLAMGRTIDGIVPLTLAFNKGAAFSISLGAASRWVFTGLSIVALAALISLYVGTQVRDTWRLVAIALVSAGAVGNLIDRVRWDRGVVDFIGPIDLGFMHWPIFNIADMAITTGAVMLAISLWREGSAGAPATVAPARADGD